MATERYTTPPLLQLNNVAFTLPRTPFTAASRNSNASPSFASAASSPSPQLSAESSKRPRLPLAGTQEGYRASLGVPAPVLRASQALQRCTADAERDTVGTSRASVAQPSSWLDIRPFSSSTSSSTQLAPPPVLAPPYASSSSVTSVAQAALGKGRPLSLIATQPQRRAPRHPARTWSLSLPGAHTHVCSADAYAQRGQWGAYAAASEEVDLADAVADGLLISPAGVAKRSCEPEIGLEWSEQWALALPSLTFPQPHARTEVPEDMAPRSSRSNHFIYDEALPALSTPTPEEAYWRTPPESSFWRDASSLVSPSAAAASGAPSSRLARRAAAVPPPEMKLPPPALPLPALPSSSAAPPSKESFRAQGLRRACFDLHEHAEDVEHCAEAEESPAQPCSATAWLLREMQDHWSPASEASPDFNSSSSSSSSNKHARVADDGTDDVELAHTLLYDDPSLAQRGESDASSDAHSEIDTDANEESDDDDDAEQEKERSRDVGWYAAAWTLRADAGARLSQLEEHAAAARDVEVYA